MVTNVRRMPPVATESSEDIEPGDQKAHGFLRRTRNAAITVSSACCFGAGAAAVIGYLLHNPSVAGVVPGSAPVAAVTGLGLMGLAAAEMLLRSETRIARNIAHLLAVSVAVTALTEIAMFVSPTNTNAWRTGHPASTIPLHPYPVTALLLLIMSVAIAVTRARTRIVSHILGSLVFVACLVLLFGHVFAVPWFVDPEFRVFPVQATTLALLMLSAAALLINPPGWVMLLLSRTTAGTMSRLLLPAAIAIPMLTALAVQGRHDDGLLSRGDLTIIVAVNMIFAAALILGGGALLQGREGVSRRLAQIVESSSDAIYGITAEGTILSWNRGAEHIYGYTAVEAVGASVKMLAPPDRTHEIESILNRLRRGERVESFETVQIRKDGRAIDLSMTMSPIRDQSGAIIGASTIARDISEHKKATQSLLASEARFRTLSDSNIIGIMFWDADGRIVGANDEFLRLTGYSRQEIDAGSAHWSDITPPEWTAQDRSKRAELLATGHIAPYEKEYLRRDRSRVPVLIGAALAEENATHGIAFVLDLTERKRADAERQALTREIQLLLESTYEGICAADVSGKCTLVNASAAAMLGFTAAEMMGKKVHELIHHHHADGSPYLAEDCPMVKTAKDGKPAHLDDEVFWRQDGTSFPVEVFTSPILADDGTIKGVVASFIDVTERQLLQTELERANRLTGLGRVAATMSHEFNNVLMGIQPFADALLRSSQDPSVIDAAKRITQSVNRGRRVTEELRGFTSPVPPVSSPIDVRSWLSDCSPEFGRLLPSNARFGLDIADTPMTIDADRDQITQIISNVILNARDAIGSAKGSIKLTANIAAPGEKFSFGALPPDQSFVHFSVVDDGPGIPPQTVSRIFEPFFTTKKSGTGLGLAITQQIITLHGGHLFVESEVGVGTIVHFFLPATMKTAQATVTSPSFSSGRRHLPLEILLVEDDVAVAGGLRALLEDEKVIVLVAGDGAEALEILETHKPQALVIDVGLPDCNGFDLYEQITASFGALPVVFSSGHADPVRINGLKTSASVRLLAKPYVIDTLLDSLEELSGDTPPQARGAREKPGP